MFSRLKENKIFQAIAMAAGIALAFGLVVLVANSLVNLPITPIG